jgi:hypothetical protein
MTEVVESSITRMNGPDEVSPRPRPIDNVLKRQFDLLTSNGILALHSRLIARTPTVIDHLVIAPSGVYVIEAYRYSAAPKLLVEGGIMTPRTSTLVVGGRDCTPLVYAVQERAARVKSELEVDQAWAAVPVHGQLCFTNAQWPLTSAPFTIDGLNVLGPAQATERVSRPGPVSPYTVAAVHRYLARAFPPATVTF